MENYKVCITPYVAAEFSNLIDFKNELRDRIFAMTRLLFEKFTQVDVVINEDAALDSFITHGMADASLVKLA